MWNQDITTPLGPLRATWSLAGLYAIHFAAAERLGEASTGGLSGDWPPRIQLMAANLKQSVESYFAFGELHWQLDDLDWSGVSPFHRQVLALCFAIPTGATQSYGAVAALADRPKAARAVGAAMARNRWPIVIPCHRVVGGSGKLTGYSGLGGTNTKRWLLDFESRCFKGLEQVESSTVVTNSVHSERQVAGGKLNYV